MAINGHYLEPMEVCLECKVFETNAPLRRTAETFQVIKKQFRTYRQKVEERSDLKNVQLTAINERLQQEVTEREAAERACLTVNEELNNFIKTVSHDLKAPIIAIQGFSNRLLKTNGKRLDEKSKESLEHIRASADRMESLVLDLLHLFQVGEADCRLRDVAVEGIVTEVIASLADVIDEFGIRVHVVDNLPEICCDEVRIFQVFENLITNAIKFAKDTPSPTIEIGYADKGNLHEFHVRDNGIGIDPKHHREIFEMFRQLKEIKDSKGTGLGLTIVQRIVNRHGGKVWVDSRKGEGATFYFTVPKSC
jgi:signal transduction histidine kinase